ncbi:RNA-directed DNA polymerase [Salinisphaera orenii]|uniref:RNA-directed DNA polymerase n=1 Tax=Salinisphaera orenii TaxID=856731 RepID=UPI000DBE213A
MVDPAEQPARESLLKLSHDDAQTFLLKPESYCSLDLPPYFGFEEILSDTKNVLNGKQLSSMWREQPRNYEDVNYTILNNKDGKYAWRPFELIHPALYVSLVQTMTTEEGWKVICDRFKELSANPSIECLSLPVVSLSEEKDKAEQVSQWWHEVEQRSIELSLEYDYMLTTDITDCYGSIYTHSISWALHTKAIAKANKGPNALLGNRIDQHVQDMRYGQTNGIPQGSVLMDLIAEMVLGFADEILSAKLPEGLDYKILRYRDDYRIFVKNPNDGDQIVKAITEVTSGLGLKLNPQKTRISSEVVGASIKDDKRAWISRKQTQASPQKHLFIIHDHSMHYPNSGSLTRALDTFYKRIYNKNIKQNEIRPLVAITVDIAYRNPRIYPIAAAIISVLLDKLKSKEMAKEITGLIKQKLEQLPNTGEMQIWLQRVTEFVDEDMKYNETLCQLVSGQKTGIWENAWIQSKDLKDAVVPEKIVNNDIIDDLKPRIQQSEFELFVSKYDWAS